jgi:hypothetical protein
VERKALSFAALALLLLFSCLWGRLCARWARQRGWTTAQAGRRAAWAFLAAVLVSFHETTMAVGLMPMMMYLARWSCFRVLRPGEAYAELDERFPAIDHKPITLNLNPVDPPEETR